MNSEQEKIKEMISSYIDNELSERQHTEIKRLIDHDKELQEYYNNLIKDRMLIASLPRESAPESIAKFVIGKIEREMILNEYGRGTNESIGKKQLYMRKLIAMAAMIAMIAVLGFVVFQIVGPSMETQQIITMNEPSPSLQKAKSAPANEAVAYKLNMNTGNLADSAKMINNLIYSNQLESNTVIKNDANYSEYKIVCTGTQAENLIEGLGTSWDKFKSPSLVVVRPDNSPVSIENITVNRMLAVLGDNARDGLSAKSEAISEPVKPRMVSTEDRNIADKEQSQQIVLTITIRRSE